MPRTDDVHVFLDKAIAVALAASVNDLVDAVHDAPLAHRPALMWAITFPGEVFVAKAKHAYLKAAAFDNSTFAVSDLTHAGDKDFLQTPLPNRKVRP
jgi:hypothetical protein